MRILIGVDGSEKSEKALAFAQTLLRDLQNASVTLVHVRSATVHLQHFGEGNVRRAIEEAQQVQTEQEEETGKLLAAARKPLDAVGVPTETMTLRGDAASEIIRLTRENTYDLVIVGSRGLGRLQGLLLGSVSDKLAHFAACPVLIVR